MFMILTTKSTEVDAWYDGPSLRWFDSEILGPLAAYSRKSEKATIDTIQQEIGKNGPYDALFGYSEGGVAIAVYLFKHWEAQKAAGVTEVEFPVRGAVFMGAVPPLINIDGEGDPALLTSEMTGEIFNIDTLHIVGSQDGIIDYCTELYRLCDEERAVLYNTGRGHVFSRNPQVGEKVQQQLRKFLQGIADSKSG
jgi:hypothetical protein